MTLRGWPLLRRIVVLLSLLVVPHSAGAHPLDELVQSSFVTVHRDSVFLELDLIAGTRVASAFFTCIDRDRNGTIDAAERRAYVALVQSSVRAAVDGRVLALALDTTLWPTDLQLRAGEGMIRLFWRAPMPVTAQGDSVVVTIENTHAPVASGYLVNALVDPRTMPIARTTRSWTQQQFALTVIMNAPPVTLQRASQAPSLDEWSRVLPAFVRHGLFHVATGFDHVLFVIALLLAGGRWQRIAGIVTSFTVAHSLTLSLAALGIIVPPLRPVEAGIAASIVIVAWQPFRTPSKTSTPDFRLPLAFGFGLLHGFGFASAMQTLALPSGEMPLALAGFNVGVEAAQLLIVLTVWPLLALLRARTPARFSATVIRASAAVVMATGGYWFVDRLL